MKQKKFKSIISLLVLTILLGSLSCISVFANQTAKNDPPPGWWLSSDTTEEDIPDWLYEQLYGSSNADVSSTTSGGLTIDIIPIPDVTSAPPPTSVAVPPPAPVAPVPAPAPATSSKPSEQVTPPPPPSPSSQEEWVYDGADQIGSGTASLSLDFSNSEKNESLSFIIDNWWIFLGAGLIIILVVVLLIVRKNK